MEIRKAKLVIWDLDETFWKGTLSEEKVIPIHDNIEIVKSLVDRGIMNSIVSKNDFDKAEFILKEWGVWDYFVFPKISWQPKGEVVKSLLIEIGLRPENTLFIDDNVSNLKEVEYYNKGISCCLPHDLHEVLTLSAFEGKDDKAHSRLKQYKVMEERSVAKQEYCSNEDFLRSSGICMQICSNCTAEEDRIYELIQRTNQLNYTKVRCTQEELHDLLANPNVSTAYVKVRDNFGDYGIVGFYAKQDNRLVHFLFSCRTIGFGIENYLYKYLGYPEINIEGNVTTSLSKNSNVDWITLVDSMKDTRSQKRNDLKVLMIAGCDLEQAVAYLKSDFLIDTEFTTVIGGYEIRTSDTCSLVNALKLSDNVKKDLSTNLPFIDNNITFGTKLYSNQYDVAIISVVDDYIRGLYKHIGDSFYVGLGGYYEKEDSLKRYPGANWDYLNENFVFIGKESTDLFERNLRTIIEAIPVSTKILLLNGVDIDVSEWIGDDRVIRNREMNGIVDKIVSEYDNVGLIDMRTIVTSKSMLAKNSYGIKDNRHFNRKVYYELAQRMANEFESLFDTKVTLANLENEIRDDIMKRLIKRIKYVLKRMGFKNPISTARNLKEIYRYNKCNKEFGKYDYFAYEKLTTMPEFNYLGLPLSFNVSYGMFQSVKRGYSGKVNMKKDYIEHGLCYAEYAPLLLSILKEQPLGKIFTYSERRKGQLERILAKEGYYNEVVAIGPMINLAPNFHSKQELTAIKKKLGKTLLVFPMHSWTGVDNNFDSDELVMEIEKLKPHFDTVLVCMYYMDIRKGKHLPYKKKGYTIVCNGDRLDFHFIQRHRDIIELADVTMSNGIGTHVGYSICLNRPHYYFKQKMEQKIDEKFQNETPEQEFRVGFEKELVKIFGRFSYDITEEQKAFVKLYWGSF